MAKESFRSVISSRKNPKLMNDTLTIFLVTPFDGAASVVQKLIRNGAYGKAPFHQLKSVEDCLNQALPESNSVIFYDARSFSGTHEQELRCMKGHLPAASVIMLTNELLVEQKKWYASLGVQNFIDVRRLSTACLDQSILLAISRQEDGRKMQHSMDILDQQVSEFQSRLLSSQMNPHFIFNLMNILQYYVIQSDKLKAIDFINRFSKLIRKSLDNSRQHLISLHDELEFLKLFIEIQQERLDFTFDIEFRLEPLLEENDYAIPPMLIQPFVENGILHGLRGSTEGKIVIDISIKEDTLVCQVMDNGRGFVSENLKNESLRHYPNAQVVRLDDGPKRLLDRQTSESTHFPETVQLAKEPVTAYEKKRKKKISHGLKIVQERIALLNKELAGQIKLNIKNREDDRGTLTELCLPIIEY